MSKIFYYGALREITGRKEEVFDIHDVKGCLASIREKYGRLAYKEARRSLITLNGISIVSVSYTHLIPSKCCPIFFHSVR